MTKIIDDKEFKEKYKECMELMSNYLFLLEGNYNANLVFSVLLASLFTVARMKKVDKSLLVKSLQEFIEEY